MFNFHWKATSQFYCPRVDLQYIKKTKRMATFFLLGGSALEKVKVVAVKFSPLGGLWGKNFPQGWPSWKWSNRDQPEATATREIHLPFLRTPNSQPQASLLLPIKFGYWIPFHFAITAFPFPSKESALASIDLRSHTSFEWFLVVLRFQAPWILIRVRKKYIRDSILLDAMSLQGSPVKGNLPVP